MVDENGRALFNTGFALVFMELALQATLTRMVHLPWVHAEGLLNELEETCRTGIKNAAPIDPGMPDDVMQAGVEYALSRLEQPFAKVRKDLGIA